MKAISSNMHKVLRMNKYLRIEQLNSANCIWCPPMYGACMVATVARTNILYSFIGWYIYVCLSCDSDKQTIFSSNAKIHFASGVSKVLWLQWIWERWGVRGAGWSSSGFVVGTEIHSSLSSTQRVANCVLEFVTHTAMRRAYPYLACAIHKDRHCHWIIICKGYLHNAYGRMDLHELVHTAISHYQIAVINSSRTESQ